MFSLSGSHVVPALRGLARFAPWSHTPVFMSWPWGLAPGTGSFATGSQSRHYSRISVVGAPPDPVGDLPPGLSRSFTPCVSCPWTRHGAGAFIFNELALGLALAPAYSWGVMFSLAVFHVFPYLFGELAMARPHRALLVVSWPWGSPPAPAQLGFHVFLRRVSCFPLCGLSGDSPTRDGRCSEPT